MGIKKKMAQDLREAGLRKKPAWELADAADRARSGDRAARSLVDKQSTALRDGISAAVRHAKPPRRKSAKQTAAKKTIATRSARKASTATATAKKAGSRT